MAARMSWIGGGRAELLAGTASGLLLALSFPPFPTRFLAAFALVPVFRYYMRAGGFPWKRSLALGFILGAAFFATLLFWIVKLIPESGATMPWVLVPALVILVAYLSCYTALFTVALSFFRNRWGTGALFAAPALWSLAEFARSHGELGFSWGVLANALAIHPTAIQGLSVYGPFGLSLVLVLLNLLCAYVIYGASRGARLAAALAFVVIALGHLLWGGWEIARFDRAASRTGRADTVAVAQPNVDPGVKWDVAYRDSLFRQMGKFTVQASHGGARLIVFPETAAPVSFKASPAYLGLLEYIAKSNGIDILTGYVDHTIVGDTWLAHNAAALIRSDGTFAGNYHKVNLLPFGEKMPWSQYFPFLSKADFGQANFIAGHEQTLFASSAGKFGVLICFESTFSDYTSRAVRDGADFLVNITNDGWFGSSRGPIQHAEMAILRSVENRVTLFRSAYTGVSMVVDPVGRVRERLGLLREGMIAGVVERAAERPLYTRHGNVIYFGMVLANLVLVCVPPAIRRSRRGKLPA